MILTVEFDSGQVGQAQLKKIETKFGSASEVQHENSALTAVWDDATQDLVNHLTMLLDEDDYILEMTITKNRD